MTLGEYIEQYRTEHSLSQRQFATQCGVSNGYISMLEKNVNPKTGKPVTPQLPKLLQIARGMGLTLSELIAEVDDMPVEWAVEYEKKSAADNGSGLAERLTDAISRLSEDGQQEALNFVLYLLDREGK